MKSRFTYTCDTTDCIWQAVDSVKQPSDHKVIDLFILLILYSTDRKKPVESLIRNKIRSGAFTEVLLQEAFRERAQVLVFSSFFKSKYRYISWISVGTTLCSSWTMQRFGGVLSFVNWSSESNLVIFLKKNWTFWTITCYWITYLEVFDIYMYV